MSSMAFSLIWCAPITAGIALGQIHNDRCLVQSLASLFSSVRCGRVARNDMFRELPATGADRRSVACAVDRYKPPRPDRIASKCRSIDRLDRPDRPDRSIKSAACCPPTYPAEGADARGVARLLAFVRRPILFRASSCVSPPCPSVTTCTLIAPLPPPTNTPHRAGRRSAKRQGPGPAGEAGRAAWAAKRKGRLTFKALQGTNAAAACVCSVRYRPGTTQPRTAVTTSPPFRQGDGDAAVAATTGIGAGGH